jgi:oligopeptide/dipeptide ABC transporter ATP-binding protein
VAILLISHDYGVVSELCEQVNVMYAGRLVESGTTADILGRPGHPYTSGLIGSLPSIERRLERLPAIRGRSPSPLERLPGCPFLARCPLGEPERCEAAPMTLEPLPDDADHRSACIIETDPRPLGED